METFLQINLKPVHTKHKLKKVATKFQSHAVNELAYKPSKIQKLF